jgi:hypothetical protein
MKRHFVTLIALSALCAACAASTATDTGTPDRLANFRYAERTYLGRPLPYVQASGDGRILTLLLADTLTFDGRGTLTSVVVNGFIYADSVPITSEIQRFSYPLSYHLKGDSVLIDLNCGPADLCAIPPVFQIVDDTTLLRGRYPNESVTGHDLFIRVR